MAAPVASEPVAGDRLPVGPAVLGARNRVYEGARVLWSLPVHTPGAPANVREFEQAVDALIEAAWEEGRP